jgi:DNA-binding MarR family transcriptional regulator
MQSSASPRTRHLDDIAEALPQRAAALSRLFLAQTSAGISRTEVGVVAALAVRPHRITELAAGEGLTQPAITRLVDPDDGRVVMVRLTPAGQEMYGRLRAEYRALVHEEMAALADADVETLARAIDVLDELIARLQERDL